jgi:signal transduction histidine kinase
VKDTAQAIPLEYHEKLFEPYFRGINSGTEQRISGLGLGLAISKKLVELHEGKIWLESTRKAGNTFAFSLPVMHTEIVEEELVKVTTSDENRTDN